MDDMPRKLDKYVYAERTRHGKLVFYFRQGKGKRIRLPAPNEPEYEAAYEAARSGSEVTKPKKYHKKTIGWLISQYMNSGSYAEYSPTTRKQFGYIYKGVVESFGDEPYLSVTKGTIQRGKENRMHTPHQARMFLDAMRALFRWAKTNDHVSNDPTEGIENPKRPNRQGYAPWTIEDAQKFEETYPAGTKERVWFHVLLYTGVRKGDAVLLGKQHIKNGIISLNTEKTGMPFYREVDDRLAETLRYGPTGDLHFIVGANGQPLNKDTFGNYFRRAAQKAGIRKPMHGIRKLSATLAAESGLSVAELESLFAWSGGGMASHYTRNASRKALAMSAAEKMRNKVSPHPNSSSPHLEKKV